MYKVIHLQHPNYLKNIIRALKKKRMNKIPKLIILEIKIIDLVLEIL